MDTTLLFGGIVISLVIEALKSQFNLSGWKTGGVLVLMAMAGAVASFYLQKVGLWASFLQIATTAGAFYAFFVRNIKQQ